MDHNKPQPESELAPKLQRLTPAEMDAVRNASLASYRALGYNQPPKSRPVLRGHAISAEQAAQSSSSLNQMLCLAQESNKRLSMLQGVLPPALFKSLKAGPIEGDSWCLLVANSASAAKLRQWLPSLSAHLRTHGHSVHSIRLKVLTG
jgi:hypothetical protein